MNEQNSLISAGAFPGNGRCRAGNDVLCEFITSADSFEYNASYSSRCRSAAPASAIPHRDSESVTTTSERSAGRLGKREPCGRVGTSTKSRALAHHGSEEFTRRGWERGTTLPQLELELRGIIARVLKDAEGRDSVDGERDTLAHQMLKWSKGFYGQQD